LIPFSTIRSTILAILATSQSFFILFLLASSQTT
jgi:hypothetical protein